MPSADTDVLLHALWINAGLSCDGDPVGLTAATPGVEEIALGRKLGCWGPVVKCNVPKRRWINGVGPLDLLRERGALTGDVLSAMSGDGLVSASLDVPVRGFDCGREAGEEISRFYTRVRERTAT
jgi:hypothetical protein